MTSNVIRRVKRKNNFPVTKSEPNLKALKKEDIIAEFNTLQANFEIIEKRNIVLEKKTIDLEQKNKSHIEAIQLLEATVKILEEQANLRKDDEKTKEKIPKDTSKIEGPKSEVYLCGDCDYVADCIHDFNDHTHSPDEDHENSPFTCNFCSESFQSLAEVMNHNKAIHGSS